MNFNKFQKEQVNKDEMKAVKGGWTRTVQHYDVDGDGTNEKVITIRDNHDKVKRVRIVW